MVSCIITYYYFKQAKWFFLSHQGYLAVGLKKYNDTDTYQQDPVKTLRQVYTRITQDAKNDEKITIAAQKEQDKLDKGQHTQQEQWLDFRTQTLNQYKQIYQRLGISFDSYCGEGELHPIAVPTVIATLRKLHLVIDEESISYVDLSAYPYDANDSLGKAVLLYNDGTFTFLAREIACLLYRLDKYNNLNKVVYVAGIEQERHFKQAFKIVQLILLDQTLPEFEHVSFGKIEGLPKHQQGFDYFLDTGKKNMIKTMKEDLRNGKYQDLLECGIQTEDDAQLEGEDAVAYIADQLSISATIIQDMSAKRSRGYHFNWHRITDARGDSGVFLQYTHARICG
jgi:arginyl-tRNA synthetase